MLTTRCIVSIFSVVMTVLGTGTVFGQNYPIKPIRIVTGGAGGGNDALARVIAPAISGPLGQPVVIDNRAAAVTAETVAKAPPDGYTLLLIGPVLWLQPIVRGVAYDPLLEFSPISWISVDVPVLLVHPSLPVKSVKELIALAKARSGELNYAGTTPGGNQHLGGEFLKGMAGVNIVQIRNKGPVQAMTALISGEVQLMFMGAGDAAPHVKSGKVRALAAASLQPSALAPGLPTVSTSGLPGFEHVSMQGVYAPAKTPAAIINQLNREIVRFLKTTDGREKFLSLGVEPVGSSAEELAVRIKSEIIRMNKVIKDAGIRAE